MTGQARADAAQCHQDAQNMSDFDGGLAWQGFVLWAFGQDDLRTQFTQATGISLASTLVPLAVLIDAATGAADARGLAFAKWATVEYWGFEHAPRRFQKMVQEADAT